MRLWTTADAIKVDEDEGRIVLVVDTDEGDTITVNIHHLSLAFYEDVIRDLGPWYHEAMSVKAEVESGGNFSARADVVSLLADQRPRPVTTPIVDIEDAIEAGYALDDPKSPGYHDRVVGDH